MSAKQIRAGDAFIELSLRDRKAREDLKKFQQRMSAFATGLKVVGGAFTAAGAVVTAFRAKSVQTFMEVTAHAKKAGLAISDIDPSKGEQLNAAWNAFKATLGAIQFLVGAALAEPLTKVLHILTSLTVELAKFVRDNQQLVLAVSAVGTGLLAAGVAITAFGVALGTSAGLAVAILVGIGAALGTITGLFVGMSDVAQEALTGIAAAILDGNFAGAFLIVFDAIRAAWIGVVEGMKLAMLDAMSFVLRTLRTTLAHMTAILTVVGVGIEHLGGGKGVSSLASGLAGANQALKLPQNVIDAASPIQRGKLAEQFAGAMADLANTTAGSKESFRARLRAIGDFSGLVGGDLKSAFGSSQGTFSGAGASLFGVGPGGGQKVSDDKTHEMLERIIKAVNGLDVKTEFK